MFGLTVDGLFCNIGVRVRFRVYWQKLNIHNNVFIMKLRITVFSLPQNEPFTSTEQVLFHTLFLISQFQPTNQKQTKELKVITSQNLTLGPDFDDSCFNVNGRWQNKPKPRISMLCDFLLKE